MYVYVHISVYKNLHLPWAVRINSLGNSRGVPSFFTQSQKTAMPFSYSKNRPPNELKERRDRKKEEEEEEEATTNSVRTRSPPLPNTNTTTTQKVLT